MKWSLIIPVAFIVGMITMAGCSGGEEDAEYQQPDESVVIPGEEAPAGTTELGEPVQEVL